ncbi:MAG: phosphatase PAP2 family protein [Planctomycetes bacterium]|nr:phosphatase PAP2 family protein [Planctomycetota bacterium]
MNGTETPTERQRPSLAVLLGVLVPLAIATAIAVWIEHTTPALREWLLAREAHDGAGLSTLWWVLSDVGLGEGLVLILFAILVVTGDRRRLQDGAIAAILAGIVVNVVKVIVARERPEPNVSYAWPSGHTSAAAAVAAALSGWRPAVAVTGWAAALGVAASRVMRGRHWPGDVLGGLFVGSACGFFARRMPLWLPEWLERERARIVVAWSVVAWWWLSLARRSGESGTDLLLNALPTLVCGLWAATRLVESRSRALGSGTTLQGSPSALDDAHAYDRSARSPRGWRTAVPYALLFVVVTLIGIAGTAHFSLLDVDEPRFATASRTMLETGNWIVPWFNGEERFDKPVFIYWLQAASMAILHPIEFAARFPSAIGVALAALATAGIGRLLGLALLPALIAGVVAGTAPLAQGMAHGSTADGFLYGAETAVAFVQVWRFRRGPGVASWLALWGLVAVAFLTKGPPAVVGPIAVAVGVWWAGGRARWSSVVGGVVLATGLVAAWAVPALVQTEGRFWTRGVMYHVVERSSRPFEGHGGFAPWWFLMYFVTIPLTMLPWSLLLPWAWRTVRSRAVDVAAVGAAGPGASTERPPLTPKATSRLLLGWALGVVATFTVVISKLPHYVLPCYPAIALAILIGRADCRMPITAVALRVLGVAVAIALPIAIVVAGFDFAVAPATIGGLAFAATLWRAAGQLREARTLDAVTTLAAGVTLSMAALFARALPMASPTMLAWQFANRLPAEVKQGEVVNLYRFILPSVTFYLHDTVPLVVEDAETLHMLAEEGQLVLMLERERAPLLAAADALAAAEPEVAKRARAALEQPVWEASGFLPTKGKRVTVLLCGRHRGG